VRTLSPMLVETRTVESVSEEWDGLADDVSASPFVRPGWVSAWWRSFGRGGLWAITVRNDGRLTGIVPFVCEGAVLHSPTNSETSFFGFVVEGRESAERLASALLSYRVRRWDISFMDPGDWGFRYLQREARSRQLRTINRSISRSPYLDTTNDWDTFEASVDTKLRSEVRRRRRRLGEQGDLSLEIAQGPEHLDSLLEEGFRVERSGWKGEYGTAIDSDPRTSRFYRDVARWAAERGWLLLAFLRLDGRPIAFDLCLEADGVHYLLKTGFDHEYKSAAPGVLLRAMMLERAFAGPVDRYEFLGTVEGANNRWKLDWTDQCHDRLRFSAFAPSFAGKAESWAMRYGIPLAVRSRASLGRILGPSGRDFLKRGSRVLRRAARR
jgi:CelD/BcsL family acetyltransferase involved in cellulose biosynthesis